MSHISERFWLLATAMLVAVAASFGFVADGHAQLRIANWNTADGPGSTGETDFTTVLAAIGDESVNGIAKPLDLLILQEQSVSSANVLANMLNAIYGTNTYQSALDTLTSNNRDEFDDKLGYVWNSATVTNLGFATQANGGPRPVYRGHWAPAGYTSSDAEFYTYSAHFKAGNTSSDQSTRAQESARLRQKGDQLGEGANIIYAGDFNVQSGSETGFTNLLSVGGPGRAVDPKFGSFASVNNTQDPGGAMNDRFDFQVLSQEFFDNEGLDLVSTSSYRAFGNDGSHSFNAPITTGSGAAPLVLSALASASDHLPVVVDYQLPAMMDVQIGSIPAQLDLNEPFGLTFTVENIANVVAPNGADELDYVISVSGDLFGGTSGTLEPLSGDQTHAIGFDTSSVGPKSGVLTVSTTSMAAEVTFTSMAINFEVLAPISPGDANGDGEVNLLDLDILGGNWGMTSGMTFSDGDFNGDGAVDLLDLDILGANWTSNAIEAFAIPEPTVGAFGLALGFVVSIRRK